MMQKLDLKTSWSQEERKGAIARRSAMLQGRNDQPVSKGIPSMILSTLAQTAWNCPYMLTGRIFHQYEMPRRKYEAYLELDCTRFFQTSNAPSGANSTTSLNKLFDKYRGPSLLCSFDWTDNMLTAHPNR